MTVSKANAVPTFKVQIPVLSGVWALRRRISDSVLRTQGLLIFLQHLLPPSRPDSSTEFLKDPGSIMAVFPLIDSEACIRSL